MAKLPAMLRPAAAAVAAAVLAGGCATVPTVGRPEPVTGASGQVQQFVQPIAPAPRPGWSPKAIVQGFLAASASITNEHTAAAKQFLAPQLRRSFKPSWAVTVVGSLSPPVQGKAGPRNQDGASTETETVTLTGQQLATISNIGQYLDNPGPHRYTFRLGRFGDQWLIIDLPLTSPLLLTQTDFEQVYQPRNLYFWSPGDTDLVPQPVFAREGDTYADIATNLVKALLMSDQDNASWLEEATSTAFPSGTTLLTSVAIVGSSAVVNLGGAAAGAGPAQLRDMAAQLVTTLTSTSYQQPAITRSVVLEINGKVRDIDGTRLQQPGDYRNLVPSAPAHSPLYFIATTGAVSELAGGSSARVVRNPAGHSQLHFATIAVSPTGPPQLAATLAAGQGCVIYYGPLAGSGPLGERQLPDPAVGGCTSLSWDSHGDIWAVTGQKTWVLPPGGRQPVPVSLPPLPGTDPQSYRVLSLRVAPDGVRVAMLVQIQGGGREVLLTAVTRTADQVSLGTPVTIGTSLTAPAALSWYDPDHLIVLNRSQLYEVPATGGTPVAVGPVPPGTQSITSAGNGQIAAAGPDEILRSSGLDQIQQPVVQGTSPAYPG